MTDKIREAFKAWNQHEIFGPDAIAIEIFKAGYQARDRELRAELEAAKKAMRWAEQGGEE